MYIFIYERGKKWQQKSANIRAVTGQVIVFGGTEGAEPVDRMRLGRLGDESSNKTDDTSDS